MSAWAFTSPLDKTTMRQNVASILFSLTPLDNLIDLTL